MATREAQTSRHWGKGIAQKLMEPVMQKFSEWKNAHLGLFTFSHSPKHVGLYQKYDFWPRYLTAIMVRPTHGGTASATMEAWRFSGDSAERTGRRPQGVPRRHQRNL